MDNTAHTMQEVQSHKNLLCDALAEVQRYSSVVVSLAYFIEAHSEDLKGEAEVAAIRAFMHKAVKQAYNRSVLR